MRGVDKRERALPRLAAESREPRTLVAELLDIASAKLVKAVEFGVPL
jgi:hypothetical protein